MLETISLEYCVIIGARENTILVYLPDVVRDVIIQAGGGGGYSQVRGVSNSDVIQILGSIRNLNTYGGEVALVGRQ